MDQILKYFFTGVLAFLVYMKLSDTKLSLIKKLIIGFGFVLIFSILGIGLTAYISEPYKSILIIFVISLCIIKPARQRLDNAIIYIFISFAMGYITFLLSLFISTFIFEFFFKIYGADIRIAVLTCLIEFLFLIPILKMRITLSTARKRGIGGIGMTLAGLIFIIYSIFREGRMINKSYGLLFSGTLLCAVGFIYWLKRETSIKFNDTVQRQIIYDKESELLDITKSHDFLATQVHDDKKRLIAIEKATLLLADKTENKDVRDKAFQLLGEMKLSRQEFNQPPSTSLALIDAILAHYFEIATSRNINMSFDIDENFKDIIKTIKINDLQSIISNLVENAILAFNDDIEDKCIFIHLKQAENTFDITVEDNGIEFTTETLINLGINKMTTRREKQGSGIGYLSIFEILRKTAASLIIQEFLPGNKFFKSANVRFDENGRYIIKSYRAEKIRDQCSRGDLIIRNI